jgi:hypothetical protein
VPFPFFGVSDENFADMLKVHLQRLIVYAQDTHSGLQRPVAERLGE